MRFHVLFFLLFFLGAACGPATPSVPTVETIAPAAEPSSSTTGVPGEAGNVQTGIWGGNEFSLNVQDHGAIFRYRCYSGTITEPLRVNDQGVFDANGFLWNRKENGGPPASNLPAAFLGKLDGEKMTLTLKYRDSSGAPRQQTDELTYGFEGPLPSFC